MGPATEEAIRPEANERKRKKNRRRRTAPIRLHEEGQPPPDPTVDSTGRRLPTVRAPLRRSALAAVVCACALRSRLARVPFADECFSFPTRAGV